AARRKAPRWAGTRGARVRGVGRLPLGRPARWAGPRSTAFLDASGERPSTETRSEYTFPGRSSGIAGRVGHVQRAGRRAGVRTPARARAESAVGEGRRPAPGPTGAGQRPSRGG